MLYETPAERDQFFEAVAAGTVTVSARSWIDHASTADIGIWGDEGALMGECARLAAEGIRRDLDASVNPSTIAGLPAFQDAFKRARSGPVGALDRLLRHLSHGCAHLPPLNPGPSMPPDVAAWALEVGRHLAREAGRPAPRR